MKITNYSPNSRTFELPTVGTTQKSFYKKAIVKEEPRAITLRSYTTDVCKITITEEGKREFVKLWEGYSVTTMKHIKSFCALYNFPYGGKKWFENLTCSN